MGYNLSSRLFNLLLIERKPNYRCFYHKSTFNVLFFGSDRVAVQSLRKLNEFRKKERRIDRLDVVTVNKSKKKTTLEEFAYHEYLSVVQWPLENLRPGKYDLGIIVSFGHLIKADVLQNFPLGMINVHPSLLPRWRGAAPLIHTLLNGDEKTGVTLMKIKPDVFDVGDIISQEQFSIPDEFLLPELTDHLFQLGTDLLIKCIQNLPQSLANAVPQSEEGVTYAKKIDKSIAEVNWSEKTSVEAYNVYRALYGIFLITTKFKDKTLKLNDAFIDRFEITDETKRPEGSLTYFKNMSAIGVLCKDKKHIYFKSVKVVGKREISAVDFYNGYIKSSSDKDVVVIEY